MCILKGFSRFVVSFDAQNGFFFNLSPLNTTVWKVISFSDISHCKLELLRTWSLKEDVRDKFDVKIIVL